MAFKVKHSYLLSGIDGAVRTNIYISRPVRAQVRRAARADNVTSSEVIRRAIEAYLSTK